MYATAGFAIVSWSVDTDIPGLRADGTETDFVLGLGVEGRIKETITARLEFLTSDELEGEVIPLGPQLQAWPPSLAPGCRFQEQCLLKPAPQFHSWLLAPDASRRGSPPLKITMD